MKLLKIIFVIYILSINFVNFPKNLLANSENITEKDPLVTKSYVDSLIASFVTKNNQNTLSDDFIRIISESIKENVIKELQNNVNNKDKIEIKNEDNNLVYKPIFLKEGKILIGGIGTEIILRTGEAKVYTTNQNGVVNVTKGIEVFNDSLIEKNNMLIVPRSDGRGVFALSDSWFIVKGSYMIK